MKLSAKARYGLAAMMTLAARHEKNEAVTVSSIARELSISKIYLEQVFAQLKAAALVTAQKGSQGGYRLSRTPDGISMYDILAAVDHALFERVGDTVPDSAAHVENAMRELVFDTLDNTVRQALEGVSLDAVTQRAAALRPGGYMYYL